MFAAFAAVLVVVLYSLLKYAYTQCASSSTPAMKENIGGYLNHKAATVFTTLFCSGSIFFVRSMLRPFACEADSNGSDDSQGGNCEHNKGKKVRKKDANQNLITTYFTGGKALQGNVAMYPSRSRVESTVAVDDIQGELATVKFRNGNRLGRFGPIRVTPRESHGICNRNV